MRKLTLTTFLIFLFLQFCFCQFKNHDILTTKRIELTKEYCRVHYSMDEYLLKDPQVIVIHYTVYPTLEEVFSKFSPDELTSDRGDIRKYGNLNVAVHFVVDRDGTIYTLLPDSVIGRHTIGFNYIALGIENVAKNKNDLTPEQLNADAIIVEYLTKKFPSVKYLIGHHEYMKKEEPHFKLFKEQDPGYISIKIDPGVEFMKQLRGKLKDEYKIELLK